MGGSFFAGNDTGGVSVWRLDGVHWERELLEGCHEDAVEAILRHSADVMLSIDCDRVAAWWEFVGGSWCLARKVTPWTGPFYAVALQDMLLAGDADGHIKIWQKSELNGSSGDFIPMEESEDDSSGSEEWNSDLDDEALEDSDGDDA